SFPGDFFVFVYLLAVARFFTVAAALDTGSSFEGMGASREVLYAVFVEPALLLGLAAVARITGQLSLSGMHTAVTPQLWASAGLTLALVTVALIVILLAENCRIPFDDPNTHLELTMIHEVMVLDHSGPDLAFILYGATLKLWLFGSLLLGLLLPPTGFVPFDALLGLGGMLLLGGVICVVESVVCRLWRRLGPRLLP